MALAGVALVSVLLVAFTGTQGIPPMRLAESTVEARLRRINENHLRLQLAIARDVTPLLGLPGRPAEADLEAVLARRKSLASLAWISGEERIFAGNVDATPFGEPLRFTRSDTTVIEAALDQAPAVKALLGGLPSEPGLFDVLLDGQGGVVAKSAPDGQIAGTIEPFPNDSNGTV